MRHPRHYALPLISVLLVGLFGVPVAAEMIGINFHGHSSWGSSLAPSDIAGVEPQSNWNNCPDGWSPVANLTNGDGQSTGVSVDPSGGYPDYNAWVSVDPPNGPNSKLMRGYIWDGITSPLTVEVSGLAGTLDKYDVLVYFDATNGSADWVMEFSVSVGGSTVATIYGEDAEDTATWDETWQLAGGATAGTATVGNYVRFPSLTADAFTLMVQRVDGAEGAINALQLVAVPEPATLTLVGLGTFVAWLRRRREL